MWFIFGEDNQAQPGVVYLKMMKKFEVNFKELIATFEKLGFINNKRGHTKFLLYVTMRTY